MQNVNDFILTIFGLQSFHFLRDGLFCDFNF